jgi:hypothetical protein
MIEDFTARRRAAIQAKRWSERERIKIEKFEKRFRCVDCGTDTNESGEYYMVADNVWAASGLASDGGMLCLACLERRIERPLTFEDFTAVCPTASAWKWHIAARARQ